LNGDTRNRDRKGMKEDKERNGQEWKECTGWPQKSKSLAYQMIENYIKSPVNEIRFIRQIKV